MAQTRRKRQTKHRGNAAGFVESRGSHRAQADRRGEVRRRARARQGPRGRRRQARSAADLARGVRQGDVRRRGAAAGRASCSCISPTRRSACSPWSSPDTPCRSATTPTPGCTTGACAAKPSQAVAARRRRDERRRGSGRALVHGRASAGERLYRQTRRRLPRRAGRPRRRARPPAGRDRAARRADRGDPDHALPLRPHRRGRAAGPRHERSRLLPGDRAPRARRHRARHPARVRPVRVHTDPSDCWPGASR